MTEVINPVRHGTVCFPVRHGPVPSVLLGMKKRGLGAGKWNGFGGKVEAAESIEAAARRELWEEVGLEVALDQLQPMGTILFIDSQVCMNIFITYEWSGSPQESEEMAPHWFPFVQILYGQMWAADREWLPTVLGGKPIIAHIRFFQREHTVAAFSIIQDGNEMG